MHRLVRLKIRKREMHRLVRLKIRKREMHRLVRLIHRYDVLLRLCPSKYIFILLDICRLYWKSQKTILWT